LSEDKPQIKERKHNVRKITLKIPQKYDFMVIVRKTWARIIY
jgi:hypothetical protein